MLIAFSKSDLADDEKIKEVLKLKFGKQSISPLVFSSITKSGLQELLNLMWDSFEEAKL